jgi:uncharacterized membrane protein (UPF0127 family)
VTGRRWPAALVLALVVAGCAGSADRTQVELGGERWDVLLAGPEGMRGLADLDGADGMLFDFDQDVRPDAVVFVMDGVAFPLDIAWFGADGRLIGTASMPVCPAEPCPRHAAPGPFRWAIEALVGAFDELPADARLDAGSG